MVIIPTITPELAAQAPNPDFAWMLRPRQETEPLYTDDKRINTKNYCISVEYAILAARLGMTGHPLPPDVRKQWERKMIEKYDPVSFCFLHLLEQIGAQTC